MLSTWKIAPALAAGCTVVHKPAEWSPYSARLLVEIAHEAGLPAGVFNSVNGLGETTGRRLTEHPDIKAVAFVGESRTGSAIMKQGADTLKRVHFELGLYRDKLNLAEGQKPSMGDNLSFFFSHQLGRMYWRYFLWNFVGRESDEEGAGGLRPWDTNEGLPDVMANNRARDNFYMIPFILGLLGIVIQAFRRRTDFLVTGLLFLMMGIALVVYLNSPPVEPRERDYIYVGSFYIFAFWIGLGVLFIYDFLTKFLPSATTRSGIATALGLSAPLLMGAKGWDNHDRSHRYHSVDFAKNLLNSCAPNAILFTGGDNDTFPLWYVQEVEGFRTDVRVCNLTCWVPTGTLAK